MKTNANYDGIGDWLNIAIFCAIAYGWIANVVKIFLALGDPVTGWFIFRIVGAIFAPLGAVLGYF